MYDTSTENGFQEELFRFEPISGWDTGPVSNAAPIARIDEIQGVTEDLARASLALARRFSAGATMWCASPTWTFHAHHVAVEFVHPVIVGKRALPAVTVPPAADMVATLRASVKIFEIVLFVYYSD